MRNPVLTVLTVLIMCPGLYIDLETGSAKVAFLVSLPTLATVTRSFFCVFGFSAKLKCQKVTISVILLIS